MQGAEPPPVYHEHQKLTYYLDAATKEQPITDSAGWEIRRRHIVGHLESVLGPLPTPNPKIPLEVTTVSESRVGAITRRKLAYHTNSAGETVHAWLLIPDGPAARRPAVLCLHQTTRIGKDEPAGLGGSPNLQYALHLAQRGFITLAPDYPSFGESKYDFSPDHGYQSGSMKAVYDNVRAVDLLQSLDFVDSDRIGCIGHSLGGHNAMFTAVFDPRIKAIVSSCGFCRFHKDDVPSWTGRVYMPRIASVYGNDPDKVPFDFTEIVAAFAPRAFLASAATRDSDFDVSGVRDVMDAALPIYRLFKAEDALAATYPDSAHDFPPEAREVAYRFLEKHLGMK